MLRTDTLYGIVARANDQQAVERIYQIKQRNPTKSPIILIANIDDTYDHSDKLTSAIHNHHDAPTSFLLPAPSSPIWLRRQNDELAYRVPGLSWLRDVLDQTGPLIAPSANPESLPPAMTITEARDYFGNQVDLYVEGGTVPDDVRPSRLLRIHLDGTVERLR